MNLVDACAAGRLCERVLQAEARRERPIRPTTTALSYGVRLLSRAPCALLRGDGGRSNRGAPRRGSAGLAGRMGHGADGGGLGFLRLNH